MIKMAIFSLNFYHECYLAKKFQNKIIINSTKKLERLLGTLVRIGWRSAYRAPGAAFHPIFDARPMIPVRTPKPSLNFPDLKVIQTDGASILLENNVGSSFFLYLRVIRKLTAFWAALGRAGPILSPRAKRPSYVLSALR